MQSSRSIIFLVYQNRSGSTFLANQLSRHSEICVCPEALSPIRHLFGLIGSRKQIKERINLLLNEIETEHKISSWEINRNEITSKILKCTDDMDVFYTLLDFFADKYKPKSNTIVFKMPFFFELMMNRNWTDLRAGRDVHIIFLVRDVRAIFNSQRQSISTNLGRPMQISAARCAQHWKRYINKLKKWETFAACTIVFYEELICNYAMEMPRIFARLGFDKIDIESLKNAQLEKQIPKEQQLLHKNISKPPINERINAWKKDLKNNEVIIIEFIASDEMIRMGYNISKKRLLLGIYYTINDFIKLILYRSLKKLKPKIR